MRIVGGRFGGRVINPPRNLRARPTTDFAKENLFNVLGNLIDLEGTEVLDLFSGTGSISYEFISRGAAGVTSVEVNAVHHNFIRRTAAAFGMENLYAVRANVFLYLKSASKRFDVIFSDAPYDLGTGCGTCVRTEAAAPRRIADIRALQGAVVRGASCPAAGTYLRQRTFLRLPYAGCGIAAVFRPCNIRTQAPRFG